MISLTKITKLLTKYVLFKVKLQKQIYLLSKFCKRVHYREVKL